MENQPTLPDCRPSVDRKKQRSPIPGGRSGHTWGAAFNAINDWVCIIDTQCIIRKTNRAVESVLNIPAGRVPGMHCHTLMHKTSEPAPTCPLPRMLVSGRRKRVLVPP